MTVQHHINAFCSYFDAQLKAIWAVPDAMQRKLLITAVLDTLSIARFPKIKGNHQRFVAAVRALCDWPDGERVSLGQLALALDELEDVSSPLAREVGGRIAAWGFGAVIRITEDPEMSEVLKAVRSNQQKQLLIDHQHVHLLYVYRCSLVHEFREPGYDMGNLGDDPTPYYMGMEDEQGRDRWELGYSLNFFVYLAERALSNLRVYLEREALNPYEVYRFGPQWRRPR